MIRRLLLIVPLLAISALARAGMIHQGPNRAAIKPTVVSGDYVPTTMHIYVSSHSASASYAEAGIYNSVGALLCNSGTTSVATPGSPTWFAFTLTGCSALSPGSTYYISGFGNGYISYQSKASGNYQVRYNTGTYPTFPTSINPATDTNPAKPEPGMYVTNVGGVQLLGNSTSSDFLAYSNGGSSSANEYFINGYVCVTQ